MIPSDVSQSYEILFVRSAEIVRINTEANIIHFERYDSEFPQMVEEGPFDMIAAMESIHSETAQACRFCRPGHPDVYIANEPQLAEALGIQLEAWHNLKMTWDGERRRRLSAEKDLKQAKQDAEAYKIARDRLLSATFRQRLKWLFTGVSS